MWYQTQIGKGEASPDERKVRTIFPEFTSITGLLFVYSEFL